MKTSIVNKLLSLSVSGLLSLSVAVLFTACRQESDDVLNYAHQDEMAFSKAERSYAAKFDVMWNGLNANYALWDYEAEHGLNWDKVYEQFRPRFVALDSSKTAVTDKQLKALLDSVIAPLHDGHLSVQLKNHATGKYVSSSPGALRLGRERVDEYMTIASTELNLNYYVKNGLLKEYLAKSSYTVHTVAMASLKYIEEVVTRLEDVPESERTPAQNDTLALYSPIGMELSSALSLTIAGENQKAIEKYNIIAYKYQYLHIPYLEPIDPVINEYGLDITYALFNDNIAYRRFDGFKLSAYRKHLRALTGGKSLYGVVSGIVFYAVFEIVLTHIAGINDRLCGKQLYSIKYFLFFLVAFDRSCIYAFVKGGFESEKKVKFLL
jgi:hypothetical protein